MTLAPKAGDQKVGSFDNAPMLNAGALPSAFSPVEQALLDLILQLRCNSNIGLGILEIRPRPLVIDAPPRQFSTLPRHAEIRVL